jgi:hypothetical protein
MTAFLNAAEYYAEHKDVVEQVLDDLIEVTRPQPEDLPEVTFGAIVAALHPDHAKAVTVAALAVMRLGRLRPDGGGGGSLTGGAS